MKRLAVVALAAALLAGCGGSPEPASPPPPPPKPKPLRTLSVVVYLLRDGRVAPVERVVRTRARAEVAALRELLRGPSARDSARGLATAVPEETTIGPVFVRGGVATVDLRLPMSDEDEGSRRPLTAQIVFTLTELPSIDQVAFGIAPQGAGIRRRDLPEYAPKR